MSLDSALRSHLVVSGDTIVADAGDGLRAVHRVVVRRRRRAAAGAAALVAAALALTASPGVPDLRRPGPRPARENEQRPQPPDRGGLRRSGRGLSEGPRQSGRAGDPGGSGAGIAPGRPGSREVEEMPPGSAGETRPGPAGQTTVVRPSAVRSFVEHYQVGDVAGISMGENAGVGCMDGESPTGANTCFSFRVGPGETRLEIVLVDDSGGVAEAMVYQYRPGAEESDRFGPFCGRTPSPLVVTPGATISIYVGSGECRGSATRGEMRVRLWPE